MSFATNLLLIIFGINIMLFAFGEPEGNSPMLAIVKLSFAGGGTAADWSYLLTTIGSNAALYIALIGIVALAAFATGGNPLTSGGGHGSLVALQIIGIAIFSALFLVPNFSTLGFPSALSGDPPILEIINMIFGIMYIICMIGLLRNIE